jgi:hypothetical protein
MNTFVLCVGLSIAATGVSDEDRSRVEALKAALAAWNAHVDVYDVHPLRDRIRPGASFAGGWRPPVHRTMLRETRRYFLCAVCRSRSLEREDRVAPGGYVPKHTARFRSWSA